MTTDFDKSRVVGFVGVNSRANRTNFTYKYKKFTIKTPLRLLFILSLES